MIGQITANCSSGLWANVSTHDTKGIIMELRKDSGLIHLEGVGVQDLFRLLKMVCKDD